MSNYEKSQYEPPGKLIEVNNHKIHIYSKGKGTPTVVFTTGSGTPSAYTDYLVVHGKIHRHYGSGENSRKQANSKV